ncbi:hypothetical protein LY76DRAFT_610208 [Colletotrichum caudatum]|nr:hypothetical protein LY76DRAFT_610208 [Colletotrichum caudatum]
MCSSTMTQRQSLRPLVNAYNIYSGAIAAAKATEKADATCLRLLLSAEQLEATVEKKHEKKQRRIDDKSDNKCQRQAKDDQDMSFVDVLAKMKSGKTKPTKTYKMISSRDPRNQPRPLLQMLV